MPTRINKVLAFTLAATILVVGCGGKSKDEEIKSEQEMYDSAYKVLDRGNFELAVERYSDLQSVYPFGKYSTQGQIDLAYAYYKAKQPEKALVEINKFIQVHPNHPNLDYAYYLKALAHLPIQTPKLGEQWFKDQEDFSDHAAASALDAFEAFREVTELFPFSDYAKSSRQHMIDLTNVFARNDIRIASFYMNRQAYIGAINRAKSVLDNYPNSELTEAALAILVYSYNQLELYDLAADSRRVLSLNFPGSKYLLTEDAILDTELQERSEQDFLFGLFH